MYIQFPSNITYAFSSTYRFFTVDVNKIFENNLVERPHVLALMNKNVKLQLTKAIVSALIARTARYSNNLV